MPVSSDDYEIEGIWCGFVHGTFCTSTRVSEKCLNLEVEQTVSKQEVRLLRTQVEQEAKDEATSVLEADSDDDQWGSWGPLKAAVKLSMIKDEKPDTAAVGSAPQMIPARKSTAHAWQWYDKNWQCKNTWSVVD